MTKLEQALSLAAQGFHIFPIEAGVKFPPRIDDFPTKASRDEAQIRRWWTDPVFEWEQDFNIGISTTRFAENEALLVVEIDNKGGKHGDETILGLEAEGRVFPATFEVRTPTGGRHLVYRTPVACRQGTDILGPGLDVRSYGGYIVGVGSTIGSDGYVQTSDREPAPAPDWIVATCRLRAADNPQLARRTPRAAAPAVDQVRAATRAVEYLIAQPEATEGSRNHEAFRVANGLKDRGLEERLCLPFMRTYWACDPMLDDAELSVAIGSAYRAKRTTFGSATPEGWLCARITAPAL
mgnify:CR=1 FL=1